MNHAPHTIADAKPFAFAYEPDRVALIIIDMQRDFVEPGGFGESLGNDVTALQEIIPAVSLLLHAFRQANLPVIHTRECHRPDLTDCPPSKRSRGNPTLRIGDTGPMGRILIDGEAGADIISEVRPINGEHIINKPGKGAFYSTPLSATLSSLKVKQLILAGVTTEVCVQSTMREANDRGYDCLLASDATASYFPHFKEATLEMITAQGGIVGWTATVAQILKTLQ